MIYIEAFGDRTVVTDHNMNEWFSVGCIIDSESQSFHCDGSRLAKDPRINL